MAGMSERVKYPISTAELERRWKAVRAAMADRKIDVLVMQNNNDHMGGYVKYFTDISAVNGYPNTVIFPREDLMTMIRQGPFDGIQDLPKDGDGVHRGIKRLLTTPSYASAYFTAPYDPTLAATALKLYAKGTIGLISTYQMSCALADHLRREFPQANFVDATDMVDQIKCVKSPEEMELVKQAALMQDGAMKFAFEQVKPGMRDSDVAAAAQYYSQQHGSEQGIYLCCSYTPGKSAKFGPRHFQHRVIQKGDCVALLVEDSGPGGMYTELGRTCILGKAPQEMKDELVFTQEARKFTLDMLKPGTPSKDIWEAFNDFMRKNGRPEETRLYCHGQGYDLVERPLVRSDEPMVIQKDMNIVVHPTYEKGGYLSWLCDNYLIGGNGPGDRLHQFPEIVVEVD